VGDLPDGWRQECGKVGFRVPADESGSAGNVVANPLHRLADPKIGGMLQLFFICSEKSSHGPALSLPFGVCFVSSSTKKDGSGQGSR